MKAGNENILIGASVAGGQAETNGTWPAPRLARPVNGNGAVHIRPYRPSDHGVIRRLCCDTGFLGKPVDPIFLDRELFADLFTRPYLLYEPEWVFIAECGQEPAGYLLGSVNPRFELALFRSGFVTTIKMLLRLAGGKYHGHPRSRRFIRWLLTSSFREQPRCPRSAAHLHIQVGRKYRGKGVGRRLWEHYESQLREIGASQCYGAFYSRPSRRPELAYSRYGFRVFDRRRTTLFEPEIRESVEVVCVCKKI